MIDLKARWAALLDSIVDDDTAENTLVQVTTYTDSSDSVYTRKNTTGVHADEVQDELPVYEATRKEIDAWHCWGNFYTLRDFLYLHDWNCYNKILNYDAFKVGLDRGRQLATFAVDDTHYLAFAFDEKTGQAKDYAEACRVLAKINLLRNLRGLY